MERVHFASFDIETIPHPELPEGCIPVFDPATVAIGNLKDPAKIEEKINTARKFFERDQNLKASTDPDRAMICCFCGYDSETRSWTELFAKDPKEERALLFQAWEWIGNALMRSIPLVSFNGKNFDLPVLMKRAMLQDVYVPPSSYSKVAGNRYAGQDRHHVDLMLALGNPTPFSSRPEVKSFDYYLARFGFEGKPEGWDGSKVYPAFLEGWFEDIQVYCRTDVELLNALFRRVQPWVLEPRPEYKMEPITHSAESED